jgi:hypothetical protein
MGELCTHLTIERVRPETLALKYARQFSTLLERGHWKSTRQGNSLVAYSTARTVLNGGMRKRTARQRALSLPNWNLLFSGEYPTVCRPSRATKDLRHDFKRV